MKIEQSMKIDNRWQSNPTRTEQTLLNRLRTSNIVLLLFLNPKLVVFHQNQFSMKIDETLLPFSTKNFFLTREVGNQSY